MRALVDCCVVRMCMYKRMRSKTGQVLCCVTSSDRRPTDRPTLLLPFNVLNGSNTISSRPDKAFEPKLQKV